MGSFGGITDVQEEVDSNWMSTVPILKFFCKRFGGFLSVQRPPVIPS